MSTMLGMDTGAVRALAQQMEQAAGDIDNLVARLTSQLGSTQWVGNDSNSFRNDWNSTHVPALKRASAALTTTASTARRNAEAQDSTSSQV